MPSLDIKRVRSYRKRIKHYSFAALLIMCGVMTGVYFWELRREWVIDKWTQEYEARGGKVAVDGLSPLGEWSNVVVSFGRWGEWVFRRTVRMRAVAVMGFPIEESDHQVLSQLREILALELPRTKLSDGLIDCLKRMPDIRVLTLPDSEATDEALSKLCRAMEGHKSATVINLGKTQVTETGMKELIHLQHLMGAEIVSPHVKDVKASFLATRRKLL